MNTEAATKTFDAEILLGHLTSLFEKHADTDFDADQFKREAISSFQQVVKANEDLVTDETSSSHVTMLAFILACYRQAQPFFDSRDAVIDLILEALTAIFSADLSGYVLNRFDVSIEAPDEIFDKISQNFIARGQEGFGSGFNYEQDVSTTEEYQANVVDCFFLNFFRRNHAPELTRIICALDIVWADYLSANSSLIFSRPSVMSAGDDKCRFHFAKNA